MTLCVDYCMELVDKVRREENCAELRVKWPIVEEMRESSRRLGKNRPTGPLFRNMFGVVD